eukprot:scaffold12232_cov149-Amphora_coffeaeformis.AAC.3
MSSDAKNAKRHETYGHHGIEGRSGNRHGGENQRSSINHGDYLVLRAVYDLGVIPQRMQRMMIWY